MSLTTGEMSAADLAAVVGNRNNDGFGGFGGDGGWWIILLFLCLFGNGGWGNGYGGGSNGGAGGLYPWMNQTEVVNDGFRDQMINSNISGIRDSMGRYSSEGGYSNARGRGSNRGYSRAGGYSYDDGEKEEKIEMLREMMQEVSTDEERRALQKIIRRMEQE